MSSVARRASACSTTETYACVISAKRSKSVWGAPRGSSRWAKMSPEPPAYRRALEPSRDQRLEHGLRRLVLFVDVRERRLQHVGCLARASRNKVQHARPVQRAQARRAARRRGALQVLCGVGIAGVGGGEPQLEQHLGELRRRRAARPRRAPGSAPRRRGRRVPRRGARPHAERRSPTRPGPARTPAGERPRPPGRRRGRRACAPPARARASAPPRACRPRSRRAGSGA